VAPSGRSFGLQRAWLGRNNLLLGGINMAAEVPDNGSALKGATGVRMATEVPGNVSASWRSLGF